MVKGNDSPRLVNGDPWKLTAEMTMAPFPAFVTVTLCVELFPIRTLPKLKLVGETVKPTGASVGASEVPLDVPPPPATPPHALAQTSAAATAAIAQCLFSV